MFVHTPEQEQFLTTGVYFIDQVDVDRLLDLFSQICRINRQKRTYTQTALYNVMFEIVVRYKNCGINRGDLQRLLRFFPPHFVVMELTRRKITNFLGLQKIKSLQTGTGKEYEWVSL